METQVQTTFTHYPKGRGLMILRLLKLHGPLSFRAIKSMMEPKMKNRRLHDSIARLKRKGFIDMRYERIFRGSGVFYQVTQDRSKHKEMAGLMGCRPEELNQAHIQLRELLHSENCALWAH